MSEEELNLELCEKVATDIALKAGKLIKETYGDASINVETKQSRNDLVTETDKNVEKFVFQELRKSFPNHRFIGEESVAESSYTKVEFTNEPTWIVDPVDGTMNFVHTSPNVAVCLGLAVNKESVLGIVYCPALDHLYTGRRGNGAYLNGKKIFVRQASSLADSLVCCEFGCDRSPEKWECVMKNVDSVGMKAHGIRISGSAALNMCSVAAGHTNAFYEFGLHCWDMCAPSAILKEAGGYLCDTTGGKFDLLRRRVVSACNEKVAREICEALIVQLDQPSD